MNNPYAPEKETVQRISIPSKYILKEETRGDLLEFFAGKMKKEIPYICGRIGKGKSLGQLREIRSDCVQAEARGIAFGAAFNQATKKPKSLTKSR